MTGAANRRGADARRPADGGAGQPVRRVAIRLFLTCWVVYGVFFTTDVVREHYLAVAIGEDLTFRVDPYGGLHPDLFEIPGRGWHIGNNPGASMIAAIPYAVFAPAVNAVAARVQARREAAGMDEPPEYRTEWELSRGFYREAWRRGLDVKLGLAAWVTHAFGMAPLSAAAVALMFLVLAAAFDGGWTAGGEPRTVGGDNRTAGDGDPRTVGNGDPGTALVLALIFAFATPVFFRTGFLNQNLLLGYVAFAGFAVAWNPAGWELSGRARAALAGLAGGLCVLLDYSGVVAMAGLYAHLLVRRRREGGCLKEATVAFAIGAAGPIGLLWFYQWKAFGNPFLPGQHWMPPVEWIDLGYQGYGLPQPELLWMLAADHRFGLFVSGPLFLLALAWPWIRRRGTGATGAGATGEDPAGEDPTGEDPVGRARGLPALEGWTCLLLVLGFLVFFAGSNYTRLQFNTGVRYMAAAFPFAFLPAAAVWRAMPRWAAWAAVAVSLAVSVPLAMYREVERPLGVIDPILETLRRGPDLPVHRTVTRMEMFPEWIETATSPWVLFPVAAAMVWAIWRTGRGKSRAGRGSSPPGP